ARGNSEAVASGIMLDRQDDAEYAAAVGTSVVRDLTQVRLDDLAAEVETYAGSRRILRSGAAAVPESLEELGFVLRRNAGAAILHSDDDPLAQILGLHFDGAAARTEFDGIAEQIDEETL